MEEEEEVQGVWVSQDRSDFEVYKRGETVEFTKDSNGEFYIGIDGYQLETFRMNAEQFDAFKRWIMEN